MPTYQYTCTECATPLEAVQSFSDPALTVCPSCGGRLRKVFSAVGVVFKGSGFYRTDSRDSGKKPSTVSADAGSSSTEAGAKTGDTAKATGTEKNASADKTSSAPASIPKTPAGSGASSSGGSDRAAPAKKPSSSSTSGSSAA